MQIRSSEDSQIIANNATIADTFTSRLKGLMFRQSMEEGEALVIQPCNMIHTFGMKFPIDVLFVSKDNKVEHLIEDFCPNRISPMIHKAFKVVELPVGVINKRDIQKGHIVSIDF